MLLLLLLPPLTHAKPLITPATALQGKASAAALEAASQSDPQSAAMAREAGDVTATEPVRSARPSGAKSPVRVPGPGASAATPGLYLSRIEDRDELRLRFRFAGLLPDASARSESHVQADVRADGQVQAHAKPHAHAHLGAQRVTRQRAASTEAVQSSDPCLRHHSGTLVIRTGQANSPCSGAEFRVQMARQLKAAMAELDAEAPDAGSPVMKTSMVKPLPAARHITLTAPPFTMAIMARAPGEDNLRRLNSRAGWAEQYQSRMAEIRIGQ